MTEPELDACADLAAAEDDRPAATHRERIAAYLAEPDRVHSLVATIPGGGGERVVGAARVAWFSPAADAPANVAPAGWYLLGLVVAPEHRRHGIGLALSAARVRYALERAPEAWYFTGTRNHASFALHARLGFEAVTRDFWFPRVPFDHGGVLCRVTADTARHGNWGARVRTGSSASKVPRAARYTTPQCIERRASPRGADTTMRRCLHPPS